MIYKVKCEYNYADNIKLILLFWKRNIENNEKFKQFDPLSYAVEKKADQVVWVMYEMGMIEWKSSEQQKDLLLLMDIKTNKNTNENINKFYRFYTLLKCLNFDRDILEEKVVFDLIDHAIDSDNLQCVFLPYLSVLCCRSYGRLSSFFKIK